MEPDFQPSVQQLEAILQDPKDSYTFVSTHGKNPQLIPYLIQLLTQPSYETNSPLRTQAAILIRNALDSWYRKLSPLQIENSAKVELGKTLIENVLAKGERDSVVRKQVTLCVGKIGKSNLDANLSNLFEDLTLHIRNVIGSPDWSTDPSNFYILNGCLGGFYQIIQNLITNRSARGQLLLREVASTHFSHIHHVYSTALSMWTAVLSQQTTLNLSSVFHSQPVIELSRICLKILSQMSTYAWKEPHKQELPTNFLKQSINQWVQILNIRQNLTGLISSHKTILNNPSSLQQIKSFFDLLHKHLFKFGKLLIQILDQDPNYLNPSEFSNQLKQTVWQMVEQGSTLLPHNSVDSQPASLAAYPERIIIQSLRIMSLWMTNRQSSSNLSPSQSVELAMTILQRLLKLQPHSLQFWNEDSEAYDNEEDCSLENRSFDVRSCSANVLTGLLCCYPHEISNVILHLYSDLHAQDPNDLPTLLQYESIYFGIGLAAHHFAQASSGFNLDNWITQKFMPVLCQTETSGAILRRRIAWVLGQFAKQDLDCKLQSSVYVALSCLLENPSNDIAVKLATCRALKATANWEAVEPEPDTILPHLEMFIKQISGLLSSVENLESQKILTETLRLVIEKARLNITPYALELVNILACLWQQVGESPSKNNIGNHLHNAIIVTISALVEAIGPSSQDYHPTIIVFVEHSINPNNPSSIYLQEDGLILWLAIARQAETLTPSLTKLLFALATLIGDASDSLGILLKILQSYLLLDCQSVLNTIGCLLSKSFAQLMGMPMGLAPTKTILQSIECIVKCANPSVWQAWFEESDCFLRLMQRSTSTDDQVILVVKHLLTVCRIIVTDVQSFFNSIGFLNRRGISPTDVLSSFCHTCLDRIDNVGTAQERKLIAAALACLVTLPNPIVISNLAAFVSIWSSVLAEGDEILNPKTNTYSYAHETEEVDEYQFIEAGAEGKRLKELLSQDPVRMNTLDRIISEKISLGGQPILTALNSLDNLLINELQQRLTGSLKG
ncbi:uncharacterized protein PGTG_11538 [Puccinia graminis f. sp. tritici CRL 75-36-700-3]|uniref:Importin-7/11-like TPR repeats domain-containing protein n=1 Tax=Puccinia graminis f. sp. tritici (strain CRL 75-36-700-3 / race SCCL) TaxID=418459 RepID=E3KM20_PUCGT|nr:uncharacterized protein PGTG_11538 [Puccinia graminis f. sp. tritici CRL 75-36-700-3]EFP85369.2 hypothetical protein PGTG_11538 [Puccinia graminis f. sp. tritici CRL 75-36-700-3]